MFLSPIVFTPQRGREITKLYLRAAGSTLADADPSSASAVAVDRVDLSVHEGDPAGPSRDARVRDRGRRQVRERRRHHLVRRRRDDRRVQGDDATTPGDQRRPRPDEGDARTTRGWLDDAELGNARPTDRPTTQASRASSAWITTGRTVASMAFGLADRRYGIADTPSTRFGVASGTKAFTALTVMSLVADGSALARHHRPARCSATTFR